MKFCMIAICMAMVSIISTAQTVRINEVMSSNTGVIADVDGESSDWIEFFNSGTSAVNLNGFGLSDTKSEPFKWIFPNYSVQPGEYLIVFASDKDRREAPGFWNTIISQGDDWKFLVPAAEPASTWRLGSFVDTSWRTGKSGFGMGDSDDATIVTVNRSIFLRKKFTISNLATVQQVVLHMDYDDGFVAYLNGVEIARAQMDGKGSFPRFDAEASGQHEALMYAGQAPEKFNVSNFATVLKTGENTLAIQVHNINATSSDFSAIPFLSVETADQPVNPRLVAKLDYPKSELHTNFKLSAEGESLYLTNALGILTDSVRISPLQMNHSLGRSSKDAARWALFTTATPGKINSGEEFNSEILPKPVFSMPGGIYPTGLTISITTPNVNDTIYYTMDGSVPTKTSSRATGKMDIRTSKVVKARILKTGVLPGEIVTNSYLTYTNNKMPVVSISMTPADLWDYNTGIYVDGPGWTSDNPHFGANYWMDWEKACHLEMMETTGKEVVDVNAGISIFGNWSRANPQKSLAIYCRKIYGDDAIKYKIFSERPYDEYNNIVLRNSGNDWNSTMFRDGLMTGLTLGLNMEQQAFRPATVFLNGEYWGIHNIREKINEHMIAQHNDVDKDSITILENHGTVIMGSANDYWDMFNFASTNNLAIQANYNRMLDWMDVNSFIDYFASQIYFMNHDWPGNNIRYWKTNDAQGRFRWILYDTDFGMGQYNPHPTDNSLEYATTENGSDWPNPQWSTLLLRKLLENTGFRDQFVNRFADLLNSNFRAENVNKAIDLKRDAITDEIANHLKKWYGGTKDSWLSRVQNVKNFATARPARVFEHMRLKFNFQTQQLITASADSLQGMIQLNSLKLSSFPWKGHYFPNVPITLTAIPRVGYRFVKWTGVTANSDKVTITVTPQANMILTAVFESDGNHYQDVVINEISYNNDAALNPGDWIELTNKGQFDIDISGWKITDSDPNHQYIFAANTLLRAGTHLVVSNDLLQIKSVFPSVENLYGPFGFGLSSTQDAVKIYSVEGQLIDEVNYNNLAPWPTEALEELWSIELGNPASENNNGSNWVLSAQNGTPGLRNTAYLPNALEELPVFTQSTALKQNYPNPFSEGTTIEFELENPGKYSISVLDVNSRVLKILKGDDPVSSVQTIYWDGKDESGRKAAPGIYFYRLEANGHSEMKRMVKVN